MKLSTLHLQLSIPIVLLTASCQNSGRLSQSAAKSSPTLALSPHTTATSNYSISAAAGLESLVRSALSHHPSLTAAQQKINRLEAKVPQAEALPDPKARVSVGRLAETAAGRTEAIIGAEHRQTPR